ncbi:hypothetical protein [uncultured Sphingomonas sp.]|uniref:hypothetical protein n=1 Tax=uncultured Sphingomonas sp. TaxID=158754 RepID=UPI0025E38B7A|nr:hypothetical protein [uncultured Sphingomonas sp.]
MEPRPAPDDDPPTCDGVAHAWRVLPGDGDVQHAVARCCGVRAISRFGVWSLVKGDDPAAPLGEPSPD